MIRIFLMASLALAAAAPARAAEVLVVNEINVTDAAKFQTYAEQVPATLKPFGGQYVVRGGAPEQISGTAPAQRVVILRFPDRAAAKAWRASAAYQKILPIRDATSTSVVYVVDVVAP
jgi:uncharacterized protein (DUF1330 family)